MKLIRLTIILIIFSSCKKSENNKQNSAIQDSYQKTEVNNDNHIENIDSKKDCVIYSDSIKIKKWFYHGCCGNDLIN